MTRARNDTQSVMEATGITPRALARKLGVSVDHVRAWASGEAAPPRASREAIEALLTRAKGERATRVPRVAAPAIDSRLVCADSIDFVRELPDACVDMILSDIPYGIGLDDWDVLHDNANSAYLGASEAQARAGKVFGKRHKPINGWSAADREIPREYERWCARWAGEWLRVLRPGGSALVFAGRRFAHRCVSALEDAGFAHRDVLAWLRPKAVFRAQRLSVVYKKRGALADARAWAGWRVGNLRPRFEPIVWCFKPYAVTIADNVLDHGVGAMHVDAFRQHTGGVDNVLDLGFAPGEARSHPAQKPVALLRALIDLCTRPGQLVLDPFAGSGSTAVAALELGRRYLAVERDAQLYAGMRERLCRAAGGDAAPLSTPAP